MTTIATYKEESAVSVSIRGYGNVEGLIPLCLDNSMEVDSDELVAAVRTIDESKKKQIKQLVPLFPSSPVQSIAPVIVESGQNIVDLALQETGGIDGIYELLLLNGVDFDSEAPVGSTLKVKGARIVDLTVRQAYKAIGYKVNTGTYDAVLIDNARILEDGSFRLLEDGSYRLLE